MLDIILFAVLGIGAGIVAGLLPGIHPNTVAAFIVSISPAMLGVVSPQAVAVFIISCTICNSFLNFIPSVFIGAPELDTALSVLPGHRLLLEGKGYEAVYLTVIGGLGVIVLSVLLLPVVFFALPFLYQGIKGYIFWILAAVVLLMFWTESSGKKKLSGVLVFALSGILGILVFGWPILPSTWMLFPVFTGLFGVSTLLVSLKDVCEMPRQDLTKPNVPNRTSVVGIVKGFFAGMIVGILPGVGPAQAAVVVDQTDRKHDTNEFLVALGGISTVSALFSLLALYLISKPRSGAAIAVQQVLGGFGFSDLLMLVATAVFVAGISAWLTLKFTKGFAGLMSKINYRTLSVAIIVSLVSLTLIFTGLIGLFVLGVSTAIGVLPALWGIKRTHSMGVLMLPVMLWYLGIVI